MSFSISCVCPASTQSLKRMLGPAALVMQQNGIVIPPNGQEHHQQSWHRDLPYQSWVSTKPLALSALAILDDFTPESGATLFLPGSHQHADFPSEAYVQRWAWPACAAAGTIVVFDAMCFHRGGVNRGAAPRRAVNTLFGVPLLAQQIAFTDRPDLDAKLRRRLGTAYQPAADTDAWRTRRADRLGEAHMSDAATLRSPALAKPGTCARRRGGDRGASFACDLSDTAGPAGRDAARLLLSAR